MKVLIVSDSHRCDENMENIIEKEAPFDVFIHLGDIEGSEDKVPYLLSDDCKAFMVRGNNDFFSDLDEEMEIKLGKHKAFITHGHTYSVSLGTEELKREAISRGCDIAMFGHTHRPYYNESNGVIILSPGSISFPRQEGRQASYAIMNIDGDGKIDIKTFYIEK